MYVLYADEAGNTGVDYDNRQQPIFSLSGIVVDTDEWNNLNDYITEKQKIIIPEFPDCELHATEIFNSKKWATGMVALPMGNALPAARLINYKNHGSLLVYSLAYVCIQNLEIKLFFSIFILTWKFIVFNDC